MKKHGASFLYQPKTNSYRKVILSPTGKKLLDFLENDINYVFSKNQNLGGGLTKNSFIRFVNFRLNDKLKRYNEKHKLFRSHSFRINLITELLKENSIQYVANLVGHKQVSSTMIYNRDYLEKEKASSKIEKIQKLDFLN